MVNNLRNISAYPKPVPENIAQDATDRSIAGGPLYKPQQVFALVEQDGSHLQPWTKKCVKDLEDKLSLDHDGAAELVREAVTRGAFRGSQWCQGAETLWAACDVYVLKREEYIQKIYKYLEIEYYIKFAIHRSGKLLLLISCHNPEDRG